MNQSQEQRWLVKNIKGHWISIARGNYIRLYDKNTGELMNPNSVLIIDRIFPGAEDKDKLVLSYDQNDTERDRPYNNLSSVVAIVYETSEDVVNDVRLPYGNSKLDLERKLQLVDPKPNTDQNNGQSASDNSSSEPDYTLEWDVVDADNEEDFEILEPTTPSPVTASNNGKKVRDNRTNHANRSKATTTSEQNNPAKATKTPRPTKQAVKNGNSSGKVNGGNTRNNTTPRVPVNTQGDSESDKLTRICELIKTKAENLNTEQGDVCILMGSASTPSLSDLCNSLMEDLAKDTLSDQNRTIKLYDLAAVIMAHLSSK